MLPRMHFARENCQSELVIRAYSDGRITIGEQTYARSLILTENTLVSDWRPQTISELLHTDFQPILDLKPEIVLLGTGSGLNFPSPALTARLLQNGIGVEVMDTAAACRTYNILLAEQRHVAAALLLS